jgi:RNA polymerase sigma-70 factor (ECF subfamily)
MTIRSYFIAPPPSRLNPSSRTTTLRYSRTVAHVLSREDDRLVERLRRRDESVFEELMRMYDAMLLRVAQIYVASRAVAEDVVQETWIAVLNGIDRFEGRSSLKTWIFRILTNIAKTRGQREGRTVPFSALERPDAVPEAAVDADRFLPADHERWPGHWASKPEAWPEERLLAGETRAVVERAIEQLPPAQRAVISLRDIEGWSAEDTCNALELTETNQRVLLHRARSKVRQALENYFSESR